MEEAGADALRFALIHGATPGRTSGSGRQARARPELREQALERRPVRARGPAGEIAADAVRRPPGRRAASGRPSAGSGRARRPRPTAVDAAIADYQFGEVTRALYDGIWSEFCDWGIELAKVRLADRRARADASARRRGGRWSTPSIATSACSTR